MLETIEIKSFNASLYFQTNSTNVIAYFLEDPLPKVHIPGYKVNIVQESKINSGCATFRYIQGEKYTKPTLTQSNLVVTLKTKAKIPPGQFVFALLPIFASLYELKGFYGVHAAVLSKEGSMLFILGETKFGKSSLAAKLNYDHGFKFIADEKVVIDLNRAKIVSGAQMLSLRDEIINGGFFGKDISNYQYKDSISTPKGYYLPKALMEYPVTTKNIIMVFPHFADIPLIVEKMNDFTLSYLLFENISATIRGCLSVFVDDALPLPIQDTDSLSRKRAKSIDNFLKIVPHKALSVTGNLTEILQFLLSQE